MKQVNYQGQRFEVESWAQYICADEHGVVWVFEQQPYWSSGTLYHPDGMDWKVGRLHYPPVQKI